MSALLKLQKSLEKKKIVTVMNDPTEWISTGNAALNYRLSGDPLRGIPNKRSILYWGESGTGKTFLTSNAAKDAQDKGYLIIYVDTEDSISEDYMEKIGIDLSPEKFLPISVDTIEEATAAIAEVFKEMSESDKFILIIDSLAGMLSEKEATEFSKGDSKGDQGQIAKKLKLFVKNINKKISEYDAFCIMVTHAYLNQDMLNGEGRWICSGGKGMQFFPSMSVRLEKAKLKDDADASKIIGVRIKSEVTKTRFTVPNQKTELHVPYTTGMDFFDGFLDVLEEIGIVQKNGGWYSYEYGETQYKFQASKFDEHKDRLMEMMAETAPETIEDKEDLDIQED